MQQVILRCTDLFGRQYRINCRNATEIPVFSLRSVYSVRQMHMYNLCHIIIILGCKYTK